MMKKEKETALDKIVKDLNELGISNTKIVNRLKQMKQELLAEDEIDSLNSKKYNILINGLLHGGEFLLDKPTPQLMGLIKTLKKKYGSEPLYYILYQIRQNDFIYKDIYSKTNDELCKRLMYLLGDKTDEYIKDYIRMEYKK